MPKKSRLANDTHLLIDRIKQRLPEVQQADAITSALLADVVAHLQSALVAGHAGQSIAPLRVRTLHELQPVLKALRERCIQEAAKATLGASAGRWLSDPDAATGTSRLEVSKQSRAQLLRLRAVLSSTRASLHRS